MTTTEILNLHQLADTLTQLAATQPTRCDPHTLDQIAESVTSHHQQTGGPLRHALGHILTHTDNDDQFAEAVAMFSAAVELYAPPPPGQLTLF